MGWFDIQIRERRASDRRSMQKSYQKLASVVDGHFENQKTEGNCASALLEIGRYLNVESSRIPSGIKDINEQMEYLLRPAGIMWRRIRLEGEWWKDIDGPILCEKKEGTTVALLPDFAGRYSYYDYEEETRKPLNRQTARLLEPQAVCFYEPLPQRALTGKDLFSFLKGGIGKMDQAMLALMGLLIALTGMVTPAATSMLFDAILPSGKSVLLYTVAVMLLGMAVTTFLLTILQSVFKNRIQQKMKMRLRSAMFARIMGLPVDFFKKYSSGDMAKRVMSTEQLCSIFCSVLLGTGLTAVLSLVYVGQIFMIAPSLTLPALAAIGLQLAVGIAGILFKTKVAGRQLQADAKLDGVVFSLFSGIQKIKLAGSERRAFAKWARVYSEKADAVYNPPLVLKAQMALSSAVAVLGMYFLYSAAAGTVSLSQYVAFNTTYSMVSASLLSLVGTASSLAIVKPILELAAPILEAEPETKEKKETVHTLSGSIELNHVSFRYTDDGPLIINDLSLKINRGQYVAIVGTTGCGKSTLMRLMLGFETPQKGAVYYDGKDLSKVDQRSLRKKIGVVLQNGRLFADDIFANIAISAPGLTLKEAWEAAEIAGIADDIRDMPMGMNTILSEGGGGISGGQRQRILIARAIAHKPKILMLDEATSALDNLTQKKVSDSLDQMKCTRIVIAHRLSTIRQCDRIIVLDKGKIIEDGTYEELSRAGGFFAKLVERQQITPEGGERK